MSAKAEQPVIVAPGPTGAKRRAWYIAPVGRLAIDLRWLAAGLICGFGALLLAMVQAPRPDPYQPPTLLSLDWWRFPIEINGYHRWPIITGNLRDISVTGEPRQLWVVGEGGLLLHSSDDGESWSQVSIEPGSLTPLPIAPAVAQGGKTPPAYQAPNSGAPANPAQQTATQNVAPDAAYIDRQLALLNVRIADLAKQIDALRPRGRPIADADLRQIASLPPATLEVYALKLDVPPDTLKRLAELERELLAVQAKSAELEAQRAKLPAAAVAQGTAVPLAAVRLVGKRGWAVGRHGVIVETSDGGAHWTLSHYGTPNQDFVGLYADDTGAVVIGGAGAFFAPLDATRTPIAISPADLKNPKARWAFDRPAAALSVAIGDKGAVVVGKDGLIEAKGELAAVFDFSAPRPKVSLNGAWLAPAGDQLWVAGGAGTLLHYRAKSSGFDAPRPPATVDLYGIAFDPTGTLGWVVGDEGSIFHTRDRGATWQRQAVGRDRFLMAMNGPVTSDSSPWHAPKGEIIEGSGTTSHRDIREYRRWPAPWYYLSWFVAIGFVGTGIRRRPPPEITIASMADRGMSDRPLTADDVDLLDFNAIARAISKFIRNENTLPPLTIAVTGEWGSGKSSILNRVKGDLEDAQFRPIWFNAWHHQNDESLLAALLQTILADAIPPWWSIAGLGYRFRLFAMRFRRRPVFLTAAFLILLCSLGYLLVVPVDGLLHFFIWIGSLFDSKAGTGEQPATSFLQSSPFLAFLASAATLIFALRDKLGAIGVPPLRQILGGGVKANELSGLLGFRHKFAGEFRDVTEALKPSAIVILIDDLDRCRAESAMRTLELMNFLVSSGDCYIVAGMAPQQVLELIAEQIGDVVKARRYLDKLINVEVPVPAIVAPQKLALLKSTTPREDEARLAAQQSRRVRRRVAVTAGLVLLGVAAVAAGYGAGRLVSPQVEQDVPPDSASTSPPATTQPAPNGSATSTSSNDGEASRPDTPAFLGNGEGAAAGLSFWPIAWLAIALLFVLGAVIRQLLGHRSVGIVKDSPIFTEAIDDWGELIGLSTPTPRATKRFMNRLRYIAMRQRSEDEPDQLSRLDRVPESTLVALSAIEAARPECLEQLQALAELEQQCSGDPSAVAAAIRSGIAGYREQLAHWPPDALHVERYRWLTGSVRIK